MNTILLQPTDVLFFRDGRPMGGASSGHGSAWPAPTIINHAFHAALHRANFAGVHKHAPGRSSQARDFSDKNREHNGRIFGSLATVGPFPVSPEEKWFFPRPADADDSGRPVLLPLCGSPGPSSLPRPCLYPVVSTKPPSKDPLLPWWSKTAWQDYLQGGKANSNEMISDIQFADIEHRYGIEINSDTGSVLESQFYSAHYLRLREGWSLGSLALARDKEYRHSDHDNDLIRALLNGHGTEIIAGGQQRVCTAILQKADGKPLPLPMGASISGTRVKWTLLAPAIFPRIGNHPGGWLPTWANHADGAVELFDGPGPNAARRRKVEPGKPISARLVAALVPKAIPISGYALPNRADSSRADGGEKSIHLAVPAGAVYYFECEGAEQAQSLANALNWHGKDASGTVIQNRRSTLMGEKGFGLGICGDWRSNVPGRQNS